MGSVSRYTDDATAARHGRADRSGHERRPVDVGRRPEGRDDRVCVWYASLWLEEPKTLQAFRTLLSSYRFFGVPEEDARTAAGSAQDQQEVTDQLGYQVRQAVEVLVHTIDRANRDSGGASSRECPKTSCTKPP